MTALFRERYHALYEEFNRAGNLYFHDALLRNYIYKGPVVEWYMRVKFHMEGWYDLFDRLLPREGSIVDLGCGYGPLPLMLDLLSNRRRILGVGYDEEKIAVADNCYSKSERLTFRSGDIRTVELPDADAFVMNDVLHYMDPEAQRGVVARCARHLLPNGVILLRDGDRSQQAGQAVTERTERWSTRILHFNKTDGALHFLSTAWVEQLAAENGLQCEIVHRDHKTSNTVYRLTRRSDV